MNSRKVIKSLVLQPLLASLLVVPGLASAVEKEIPPIDDSLDPKEWGIRNNCISLNRIRLVDVKADNFAFIELTNGKKVLMTFKNSCRGLKSNGYIHSTRTNNLCAGFDSIRVANRGNVCLLESLTPIVELDNEPAPEE